MPSDNQNIEYNPTIAKGKEGKTCKNGSSMTSNDYESTQMGSARLGKILKNSKIFYEAMGRNTLIE